MFVAVVSLTILGSAMGLFLGYSARRLEVEGNPLVAEIQAILPGSQCGQCGFPGCAGAAQALALKLGVEANLSDVADNVPMIAEVKEEICIGCTRCFKVCPTDAIMGAAQQIHVVFREACTACGKCEEVCPTESVKLQPIPVTLQSWYWHKPQGAAA